MMSTNNHVVVQETCLELGRAEASLDGVNESVVGHSARQHRGFENLHLEPMVILPQPAHSVATVTIPSRETFQFPMRRIIQLLQAVAAYSEQDVQSPMRLITH